MTAKSRATSSSASLRDTLARVNAVLLPPILVADDDPDDLFFALRLIKKTGTRHPVVTFENGAGVLAFLRACMGPGGESALLPRVLFLDLKMSGLGGFEFLEWWQQQKELRELSIIVLSNSDDPEDIVRAKRLGASRYLRKYPSVTTFSTVIRRVYSDREFNEEPRRSAAGG